MEYQPQKTPVLIEEGSSPPGSLQLNELEVVYALSRVVTGPEVPETVLDKIIVLARSVLIFDNMVLYSCCNAGGALEPELGGHARRTWPGESSQLRKFTALTRM